MDSTQLPLFISTLFFILSIPLIWWIHRQWRIDHPVISDLPEDGQRPLISIIVPARNEARNIRRCLEAILSQNYQNIEVFVVDDRSEDDTPAILAEIASRDPRVRIILGEPLKAGWAGKPHALVQGAFAAKGAWICFIDADTFAGRELLQTSLATALHYQADMFSMLTGQSLATFWEKVVLPVVFTGISVGYAPRRVNDPSRPEAIANGQFILIRRSVYDAIGGHHAVWNSVVEDRDLAQIVKGAGNRLLVVDGRGLAETRMYTRFSEIWEGWTKNIYLGLQHQVGMLIFGGLMTFVSVLGLPFWLFAGLYWVAAGGGGAAGWVLVQALIVWGYLIWNRARAARAFGVSSAYGFTFPLGMLVLGAMMFASVYQVLSGRGVTWKGRRYSAK